MTTVEFVFLGVYFAVLCVLAVYGPHRYRMAFLYYRHKFNLPTPNGRLLHLPRVTIQLPVFNEMYVVERLIDVGVPHRLPALSCLEVQVLDDSTDETTRHRPCRRASTPALTAPTSPTSTGPTVRASRRGRWRTG